MSYIDPITGQSFDFATPTTFVNNPQNVIALGPDIDEDCPLIPESVSWATATIVEPKQVQYAKSSNSFTMQEAGIFSNADLTSFLNRVLFTKHCVIATLKLLGNVITFEFSTNSPKSSLLFQ